MRHIYILEITDEGMKMLSRWYDFVTGGAVAAVSPKSARALMETLPGDAPEGFWKNPKWTSCRSVGTTRLREQVLFSGFYGV